MSTLAGNIAENAGGLRGLKYGVTKDYLMGLEFFDATGELVKSGSRTVKCVTGYNLAGMMLQSEGTLGIISQAVLKLVPPPQASKALMAVFDDMQKAAEAVAGIIAAHVVPCTLEFLDNNTIVRVDDYTKAGLPRDAAAILLIEVDGHPAQVADEAVVVERVLQQTGAVAVHVAKDAAEKFKLWEARRQALPVLARCKPTTVLEDATVPRSQIPAMMKAVNDIAKKYNVEVGTFGHAGDGNLHPTFLCDKRDKEEFARVEAAVDEMFDVAISLHGTLSGEHGIGTAKSVLLFKENVELVATEVGHDASGHAFEFGKLTLFEHFLGNGFQETNALTCVFIGMFLNSFGINLCSNIGNALYKSKGETGWRAEFFATVVCKVTVLHVVVTNATHLVYVAKTAVVIGEDKTFRTYYFACTTATKDANAIAQ